MFGVDTTSGSLLYVQKMPSLQPFGITVYGDDSQKPLTVNSYHIWTLLHSSTLENDIVNEFEYAHDRLIAPNASWMLLTLAHR